MSGSPPDKKFGPEMHEPNRRRIGRILQALKKWNFNLTLRILSVIIVCLSKIVLDNYFRQHVIQSHNGHTRGLKTAHMLSFHECSVCFFRNSDGVIPTCFLKAVLNEDLELNPTSKHKAINFICRYSGSSILFFISSTRY